MHNSSRKDAFMAARLPEAGLITVCIGAALLVCQAGTQQEASQNAFLIEARKVAGIAIGNDDLTC